MRKFVALQAITFGSGQFRLTPQQYARRKHVVQVIDTDSLLVEGKPTISFKAGEIIETNVAPSKREIGFVVDEIVDPPVADVAHATPSEDPLAEVPESPQKRGRKSR